MAVMCFSVSARFGFDSDGVFGHRSRLGPARNAEGGYGSLCSSSPCRDAGWLPAYRTSDGMLGPLFPFDLISVTLLGIDSISDWSQCAGGFFLVLFSLAGWLDSAAKSSPPCAPFSSSRYLYSSFSWFLMGA